MFRFQFGLRRVWVASRVVTDSNPLGNRKGVFDAGPDCRSLQIVAGEPEAGNAPDGFAYLAQAIGVAGIVLRKGCLIWGLSFFRGRAADAEDGGNFGVEGCGQPPDEKIDGAGVGCPADEAGEEDVVLRRSV